MLTEATGYFAALGKELYELTADQSRWSQATFGMDSERGPVGGFKHLAKECGEAVAAWEQIIDVPGAAAAFMEECADCLLLLLDATRRSGLTLLELVAEARRKLAVNKTRTWLKPTASDEPVEHVR